MKLPEFELIQPHSLEEACSILGEHDGKAVLLAGGTALVVASRYRFSKPAVYPGSRKPRPLALDECAKFWPGCRPAWALVRCHACVPKRTSACRHGLCPGGSTSEEVPKTLKEK